MKLFDLHNDALTCSGKVVGGDIIYAIWTTKLSLSKTLSLIDDNSSKMLAIEDCGVFCDDISPILNHDFKYVGLTWNERNAFAGGAYSSGGLTEKGKELVRQLNEKQFVVDTAHLNFDSFFEVTERADKIICSHTCFSSVNKHPRNLTNEQISAIINKDGIVGLCFVGDFLGGRSIEAVLRHIDWFLDSFGDKNLAIGTDYYGTMDLPENLTSYESMDKLVLALIRRGYSDSTIRRILHTNAASYFF